MVRENVRSGMIPDALQELSLDVPCSLSRNRYFNYEGDWGGGLFHGHGRVRLDVGDK